MPQDRFQGASPSCQAAARRVGSDRFGVLHARDPDRSCATRCSRRTIGAVAAIKSGPGKYPVGVTLAMQDDQAARPDSRPRRASARPLYGPWLDAAREERLRRRADLHAARGSARTATCRPRPGVELTQMGYEFWPEALEQTIRYAAATAKVPVYVTENGIGTEDDARRVEYIQRALAGVEKCLADGIDVRGYIHWSLIDNFEWMLRLPPQVRPRRGRTAKPRSGSSSRARGTWARSRGATAPDGRAFEDEMAYCDRAARPAGRRAAARPPRDARRADPELRAEGHDARTVAASAGGDQEHPRVTRGRPDAAAARNVRGHVVRAEAAFDGTVRYRLVRLAFGPERRLSLENGLRGPAPAWPERRSQVRRVPRRKRRGAGGLGAAGAPDAVPRGTEVTASDRAGLPGEDQ